MNFLTVGLCFFTLHPLMNYTFKKNALKIDDCWNRYTAPAKQTMRKPFFIADKIVPQPILFFSYKKLFDSILKAPQKTDILNTIDKQITDMQITLFCSLIDELLDVKITKPIYSYEDKFKPCENLFSQHPNLKNLIKPQFKDASMKKFLDDFWALDEKQLPTAIVEKKHAIEKNIKALSWWERYNLTMELKKKFHNKC